MPRISQLPAGSAVGQIVVVEGGASKRVTLGTLALQNATAVAVGTLSATGACTIGTGADSNVITAGRLIGGLGARAATGTLDWNHVSNATSGSGYSLLRQTTGALNAPPGDLGQFFNPLNIEYGAKDGSGQVTQMAIPYAAGIETATCSGLWIRGRISGVWSAWRRIPMLEQATHVLDAGGYKTNALQVLGARRTGWAAPSGTATRTTFATGSVTLPQLAERVKALIDDFIAHGAIGT